MIRFYSSYILVFTSFTHLFCCGIPILLGISSMSASTLLFGSSFINIEIFEIIELILFVFATIILIFLISFEVRNYMKEKLEKKNCCDENNYSLSSKTIKKNIIISSTLYIVNSVFLLSEKIF